MNGCHLFVPRNHFCETTKPNVIVTYSNDITIVVTVHFIAFVFHVPQKTLRLGSKTNAMFKI